VNQLIRPAVPADASAILAVYAPYITDTVITFETEVPTLGAFTKRVEEILRQYPYLVCEIDGEIVGYAYASRHRERAAYRYSVDVSIYVKSGMHRRGIGSALYTRLLEELQRFPYYTAYACITLPNESSVALHKSFGFQEAGIFHKDGYKAGKWLDVLWMEKPLKQYDVPPGGSEK
jgi:L-amino acid N-acyltransferase YncA